MTDKHVHQRVGDVEEDVLVVAKDDRLRSFVTIFAFVCSLLLLPTIGFAIKAHYNLEAIKDQQQIADARQEKIFNELLDVLDANTAAWNKLVVYLQNTDKISNDAMSDPELIPPKRKRDSR